MRRRGRIKDLDVSVRIGVLNLMRRLRDEQGISILYITHDLTTAYHVSDDIIVLYRGSVAEAGAVGQLQRLQPGAQRPVVPKVPLRVARPARPAICANSAGVSLRN